MGSTEAMPNEPRSTESWRPQMPPWRKTEAGELRRVGVELELIGPDVDATTAVLVRTLGGTKESVSRYESIVHGDGAGPWRVELDFAYLKNKGRQRAESSDESGSLLENVSETVLRTGAEAVVPVEVVSPPLPLPRLACVQDLIGELRRSGALGTKSGLAYAFGMQFNPEMPRLDVTTVLAYLRAFLCLQDWLIRESRIDLTRRLTSYSAPFPAPYVRKVVDPAYDPDLATLMDDYLASNPTRNRALDLLPLLTELDEDRVRAKVDDDRVKARPALHYRLPNCEIADPSWGLHVAWTDWMQVEHLAADPKRLAEMGSSYCSFLDRTLDKWFGDWAEETEKWLLPASALGSE